MSNYDFLKPRARKKSLFIVEGDHEKDVLMFDYECQDPKFSEEKLCRLQNYFSDSTDVGKLFINYPMVEAYQDFTDWPDASFEHTEVTSKFQSGQEYKNRVKNTMVAKMVDFPDTIDSTLKNRYHMSNVERRMSCVEELLQLRMEEVSEDSLASVLTRFMSEEKVMTAKYQMLSLIKSSEYWKSNLTYYEYMRHLFREIIKHNICKARSIVGKRYLVDQAILYKEYFELSLLKVLERQNEFGRDEQHGVIKVLATGVFFVADYRISLIG